MFLCYKASEDDSHNILDILNISIIRGFMYIQHNLPG